MNSDVKIDNPLKHQEISTSTADSDKTTEGNSQLQMHTDMQEGTQVSLKGNGQYWQALAENASAIVEQQSFSRNSKKMPSEEDMLLRQLNTNQLLNTMAGISQLELTEEETTTLKNMNNEMQNIISASPQTTNNILKETSTSTLMTDKEIGEIITSLMGKANDDYLKIYEHAVSQQSKFWQRVSELQAKLKNLVKADGENIKFDVNSYQQILLSITAFIPSLFVYPPTDASGNYLFLPTKEQAQNWAKEFYGDAGKINGHVTPTGELYYSVPLVSEALNNLLNNLPTSTMTSTEYQAWYTGFTAQIEDVKTFSQTLTTKYSSANSTYDSLIKLLTSTITTLFDNCKEYMRW
ncbi:TPA: IpaD/SipD/SspD family type III secretion system needle tip protein [Escherichia fergusonii]|uniref:IpaD/SipD/SspD family type III secretion system needle tip protein n=1 Tax=Escherichia fergusonii TaxID=564 RepID=UPI0035C0873C